MTLISLKKKTSVRCAVSAVRVTIFSSYDSNVMWNSNKTQSNLKPCSKHIKQILPINFCQILVYQSKHVENQAVCHSEYIAFSSIRRIMCNWQ